MRNLIELQTMGKRPHKNQSRINSLMGTVSLHTLIISVLILTTIFATILLTPIYIINNEKLKNVEVRVSTLQLALLINNLQHEYVEKMNQNISNNLSLDTTTMVEIHNATKNHILQIFDDTEKQFVEVDAASVSTHRNQLSDKIDKSFVTISHEHTFKRLASKDWNLANETKKQIEQLYDQEFQAAVVNYKGKVPPEVSPEFHEHVTELTLEKGVFLKIVPPSPAIHQELQAVLREKYNKTLQDHVLIGIDFGELHITSFVYANGHLQESAKCIGYVGLEEYDGFSGDDLQKIIWTGRSPLARFYDLKEIIRAWDSFNTSSYKLFWTFNVQEEIHGGPSVSSSLTGIQHPVESVLAKLFQKVRKASGESFYNDATRCVIAIPYDFTEDQRKLIIDAGNTAGFQEVALLDEDVSAALTLQYANGPWSVAKNIMFLQFNQLSWKIYVLKGHQSNFTRIISAVYNETKNVVNFCIKEYCELFDCDKETVKFNGSVEARTRWRRLYEHCENGIFYLSQNPNEERYPVFGFSEWSATYIHQSKMDETIQKQVVHFTHFIDSILRQKQVQLKKAMIDEVIMGGKYGNIRMVKEIISEYFNERNLTVNGIPPDNTGAYGAAVKGLELAAAAIKQRRWNETVV